MIDVHTTENAIYILQRCPLDEDLSDKYLGISWTIREYKLR